MKFRAMIVDDEPLARENIAWMLKEHEEVEVTASIGNPKTALEEIINQKPDLLYLDMRMPGLHGLELLNMLVDMTNGKGLPFIIFVTAFDRYALRAFEFHALDYLVKPFTEERFRKSLAFALERMRSERRMQPLQPFLAAQAQSSRRLVFEENGNMVILEKEDVLWVESANHYMAINTAENQHIVRKTMADMEKHLGEDGLRIHRGILVNIIHVAALEARVLSKAAVRLNNGKRLPVSRRKVAGIKQKLTEYHDQ